MTTFENKGLEVSNFVKLQKSQPIIGKLMLRLENQPGIKKSNPPYLRNGDTLGKYIHTIGFTTLENGGVHHLKIPKTNLQYPRNAP
jgi:hypothetical protein